MHAKRSSSNNLHHRENADRDHQAETQKRSWQPKLTAQPLRSNCVHNLGVIDVEGGNSQLWVSPSGESVLIDSGNGGTAATRDADRIMAAVHDAGLKQIDHLITTQYHGDHFG